jgi:large subunit ribosomal protein L9
MRVILRRDVKNLGLAGEVKEVKEGYARNYLFPRKLAEELTEGRLKEVKQQAEKNAQKQQRDKQSAQSAAEKLQKIRVTLYARGGEKGKLFGSITVADIAAALKEQGVSVDKRKIDIGQPIKTLGVHEVTIKLHPEVAPVLEILVEEEKGE